MQTTQERAGVGPDTHESTEERRGGCEGCDDHGWPELPVTRVYRGVRRDGAEEPRTVRYCDACAGLVRFAGIHDDWDNLMVVGDLIGRIIRFRRSLDDSCSVGVVVRDVPEHHSVVIAPNGEGRFGRFERVVHRVNIVGISHEVGR